METIYSQLTYLAMRIAYEAHLGVMDKSGAPYIFHPYAVADRMDDEVSTAVAFLHDVVEDTDITFDDLRDRGIPESVIGPLMLLTHDDDTPYMDYIVGISADPVATKVKLSDLTHNMDTSRFCRPMTEKETARMEKYAKAKAILLSAQESRAGSR